MTSNFTLAKKIPSYYICENLKVLYGQNLAELRLKNNITRNDLSNKLNISTYTLKCVEEGTLNNPYYYYNIYCRHFEMSSNIYLDFNLINTDNLIGKVTFLRAYYGLKSLKDLDRKLNLRLGSISEYLNNRLKSTNIEEIINFEVLKCKKK